MKTLFLTIITAYLLLNKGFGQNLVPNPSFEDTVSCPNGPGVIETIENWFTTYGTPDFYTACGDFPMTPYNPWGYQPAKNGSSYVGIVTYGKDFPDGEESISVKLNDSLIIGANYFVSFYVNLSLNGFESGYANNKLGALFSTIPYNENTIKPINNFAHVFSETIIIDTLNWTKISGTFIADSIYKYLSIGNFFDHNNTDTFAFDNSLWASYYYIDQICVSSDSTFCNLTNNLSENKLNPISIYPNPTNEFLNIDFSILNQNIIKFKIIDIMGKIVYQSEINSLHSIFDIKNLAQGLYNLSIDNQIVKQIIVNH